MELLCANWLKSSKFDPIVLLDSLNPVLNESVCELATEVIINMVASLRHVFHDWEPADLHELFGGTAAKLYGLDIEPMAALELGPTVDEIATPLDEIPDNPSMAFGRRL